MNVDSIVFCLNDLMHTSCANAIFYDNHIKCKLILMASVMNREAYAYPDKHAL